MNTIDEALNRTREAIWRDPDELSPEDIDAIIAENRRLQANYDKGVKVKHDAPVVSLQDIGLAKPKPKGEWIEL